MSSFRFNFSQDESQQESEVTKDEIQWLECEEVVPAKQKDSGVNGIAYAKMFTCGEVEIGHLATSDALSKMRDVHSTSKNVEHAENDHSDLIAGKYEGGLKIWECTHDLVEYLESDEDVQFENKKVLDLGCGAGILGIYAFLKGSLVTFQDYNKEILECVTIPNILLNIEDEEDKDVDILRCKFYSGDWGSFNKKLNETDMFDIILTSETIYNQSNYDKLINLFLNRLSKDGVVYVAAKTYYFGVGGGTRQFESSIEKNGLLNSNVCWKSSGGISREILKITKKT